MTFEALVECLRALHNAGVRYLVVGGFAVAAHGYRRATVDLDLVVQLQKDNLVAALAALQEVGFQPRIPVTAEQFADPETRRGWIEEKGMVVLNLWHARHHGITVDVFVDEPFDFDAEYAQALCEELLPGLPVRYPRLQALIDMKLKAGRERDLNDVKQLRHINDC